MSLIKCPECGNEISSSAKTCPSCGCPLTVCPECNAVYTTEPEICSVCGYRFKASEAEKQEQEKSDRTYKILQSKVELNKKLSKVQKIMTFAEALPFIILLIYEFVLVDKYGADLLLNSRKIKSMIDLCIAIDIIIEFGSFALSKTIESISLASASQMSRLKIDCLEYLKQNKNYMNDESKLQTIKFAALVAYNQKHQAAKKYVVLKIVLEAVLLFITAVCLGIFFSSWFVAIIYKRSLGIGYGIGDLNYYSLIAFGVAAVIFVILIFICFHKENENFEGWCKENDITLDFGIIKKVKF